MSCVQYHVSCTTDNFVRIIYYLIHTIHFHTYDLFDMYDILNHMSDFMYDILNRMSDFLFTYDLYVCTS